MLNVVVCLLSCRINPGCVTASAPLIKQQSRSDRSVCVSWTLAAYPSCSPTAAGRPSISSPTEAGSGRRKQLNIGRKVNSQWTMKCWNAKVISFIWRGCKFHIRLWRLTHTREQFLSRRFLSLNSRMVFRPTTCVWSESITNGGESCLMLQKNLLLITSGGLWTGPILHNEHFDASILHWEQRTTSPAALLEWKTACL